MSLTALAEPVIVQLVETLIGDHAAAHPAALERTAAIVHRNIGRMPRHLAAAMLLLTVAFDWSGLLRTMRRFHRQSPVARRGHLNGWRRSRIGVCREFVQFYEQLALFVYYSQPQAARHVQSEARVEALTHA